VLQVPAARFIFSKVCKLTVKQEFIDCAKQGKILVHKCKNCGSLHLATVYFCQRCGKKGFEDVILDGIGTIVTYTIMTVPPAGFEEYTPYAWIVMLLDNADLRISGFMGNIKNPSDLPIGTRAKIVGFDHRGILLERQ